MELDNSIKYQSKKLKIERNIKRIQELGIKTSKIEEILTEIEKDLNEKINNITRKEIELISLDEYLYADCYCKAIAELNKLEMYLSKEYETYSKIYGRTLSIESYLENITEINLSHIINLSIQNLKEIKASSTIDYRDEKQLVEKIYKQTYQLIKIELVYTNESIILNEVLKSEIDTNFIEKLLIEEIEKLVPTLPENKTIINKIKILREKGLESNYLDLELLNLLKYTNNSELLNKKKEWIIDSYQSLLDIQKNLEQTLKDQELEIKKYQKDCKKNSKLKKELLKYSSYLALLLSIISGSHLFSKKVSSYKTYHTTVETYDVNKNEYNQEEKYTTTEEDHIYLKQYFPYTKNNVSYRYVSYRYEREVFTYDVSDINYENIKDYSLIDLDKINFDPEIITEYVSSLNPSDYYQEARTIIERVIVDKNNIKTETNLGGYTIIMFLLQLMLIFLEISVVLFLKESRLKIKDTILDLKYNKRDLEEQKRYLLDFQKTLNKLSKLRNQHLTELKKSYEELPNSIQEEIQFIKIKKKIKEIEGVKNDITKFN